MFFEDIKRADFFLGATVIINCRQMVNPERTLISLCVLLLLMMMGGISLIVLTFT
jgi:hypothetical protein